MEELFRVLEQKNNRECDQDKDEVLKKCAADATNQQLLTMKHMRKAAPSKAEARVDLRQITICPGELKSPKVGSGKSDWTETEIGVKGCVSGYCTIADCPNSTKQMEIWQSTLCPLHPPYMHYSGPCVCKPPFVLYFFPKESNWNLRSEWLAVSIKTKATLLDRYDRVCSDHFIEGKPTLKHPYPTEKLSSNAMNWMYTEVGLKGSIYGFCTVKGCSLSGYSLNRWRKTPCPRSPGFNHNSGACMCRPPFVLYNFPTCQDEVRRELWTKFTGRGPDWKPNKHGAKICSNHFIDSQPTLAHPDPCVINGKVVTAQEKLTKKPPTPEPVYKPAVLREQGGYCCISGCTNTCAKLKTWGTQYCETHNVYHDSSVCDCHPPFKLFKFPSQYAYPETHVRWLKMLGVANTRRQTRFIHDHRIGICSLHFVDGTPTKAHPDPQIFPKVSKSSIETSIFTKGTTTSAACEEDANSDTLRAMEQSVPLNVNMKAKTPDYTEDSDVMLEPLELPDIEISKTEDLSATSPSDDITAEKVRNLLRNTDNVEATVEQLAALVDVPYQHVSALKLVISVLCRLIEKQRQDNQQLKNMISHTLQLPTNAVPIHKTDTNGKSGTIQCPLCTSTLACTGSTRTHATDHVYPKGEKRSSSEESDDSDLDTNTGFGSDTKTDKTKCKAEEKSDGPRLYRVVYKLENGERVTKDLYTDPHTLADILQKTADHTSRLYVCVEGNIQDRH